MKEKKNFLVLVFSIIVFIPIILAGFSLLSPINAYAQHGVAAIGTPSPPPIGSPTPPPIGTPYPTLDIPHTMELVADIYPGPNSGNPSEFIEFQGNLNFKANGVNGYELYEYDGTDVFLIDDIIPSGESFLPSDFAIFNNELYFSAFGQNTSGEDVGRELFRYDGISVELVEDFTPGLASSSPMALTVYDGALYFMTYVSNSEPSGYALTKYDGDQISLVPGTPIGDIASFYSTIFTIGGNLYFIGYKEQIAIPENYALYQFDGSTFTEIAEITIYEDPVEYNGWMYFPGNMFSASPTVGTELYRFNGTTLELVEDLLPGSEGSFPGSLTLWNGKLYFHANDEVYEYDGTTIASLIDNYLWLGHPSDGLGVSSIATNGNALFFDGRYFDYYLGFYRFDGNHVDFIDETISQSTLGSFGPDLILNTDDGSGIGAELWTLLHDPDKITLTEITEIAPDPASMNLSAQVTISVTTEGGAIPEGMVDIGNGQGNNCKVTLVNGSGACELTFPDYGEYQVFAKFELGTPYYSSSDAMTIELKPDMIPPEGHILSPVQDGIVMQPRDLLMVTASDQDSTVISVLFEAYYDGSWHTLFTDVDPSDGWQYTWSTYNLDKQKTIVRATIRDQYDNYTILSVDNLSLGGQQVTAGGYQARGAEGASQSASQPTEQSSLAPAAPSSETPPVSAPSVSPPQAEAPKQLTIHRILKLQLKQHIWSLHTLRNIEFPY
ncbi:hypothetical protein KQH54_00455 [bacterium]|nr:hypothetical protein [bacterium]